MTDISKILKMIETVDPNDTERLDEIDARVFEWFLGITDTEHEVKKVSEDLTLYKCSETGKWLLPVGKFTRSRDALKAIRPEGWKIELKEGGGSSDHIYCFVIDCWTQVIRSEWLPSEELAELYAVLQAIQYERNQKKDCI